MLNVPLALALVEARPERRARRRGLLGRVLWRVLDGLVFIVAIVACTACVVLVGDALVNGAAP
jgi:hypothetical protein